VTADGRIFWVEGQRIAEPFKLTPRTCRRLVWRWQRLESRIAASKGAC
jgi:hypothetical protein